MSTHFEDIIRLNNERLADLKRTTAEIEREITAARVSLEQEFARSVRHGDPGPGYGPQSCRCGPDHPENDLAANVGTAWVPYSPDGAALGPGEPPFPSGTPDPECPVHAAEDRTTVLINHGRHSAARRALSIRAKVTIGAVVAAILLTLIVILGSGGGASWPASVARVQSQIAQACQNPDVRSEPGQLNFACAKRTRQILWVFALITSNNDPGFVDQKTGRVGLEPIAPAQGGAVASSLNLHHPYDPSNPIDSLQVAARAINDIIGGATTTGADGNPVVQPGLEGNAANCARYTGSGALTARQGFPDMCARPVNSPGGQAALVRDVYRKWVVGAPRRAARDAAVLFENAGDPGNPQVQAILQQLPGENLSS